MEFRQHNGSGGSSTSSSGSGQNSKKQDPAGSWVTPENQGPERRSGTCRLSEGRETTGTLYEAELKIQKAESRKQKAESMPDAAVLGELV